MVETHIGRAHARIESASEVIDAEMEIDRLTLPPIASMGSKAVANARPPLAILSPSCALPPRLDLESRPRRRQTCHDPTQPQKQQIRLQPRLTRIGGRTRWLVIVGHVALKNRSVVPN
jgi:hypothetical protein